jgi:predicted ester cyclase/uncharacterized protein YndB with AHSA1/START domain
VTSISNHIRIDGPIALVFDLVTTTRFWPRWHPATHAVSGVTDRPLQLGDRVTEHATIGGRAHAGTWTVVEHDPPTRLVLQIGEGRIEIAYTFEADADATELTRVLRYRPQDFAGGDTDPAGLEARMDSESTVALERLKRLVEFRLPLERNARAVRDILERAFNQRELTAVDEGFTSDAAIHDPGAEFRGPAQLRGGLQRLLTAFPDFHFTVLDQLVDEDRVVIRYRGQGTHAAEFLGMPATGRSIDYTGLLLARVDSGRIAELWAQPDQLGLLKQLGAAPYNSSQ